MHRLVFMSLWVEFSRKVPLLPEVSSKMMTAIYCLYYPFANYSSVKIDSLDLVPYFYLH